MSSIAGRSLPCCGVKFVRFRIDRQVEALFSSIEVITITVVDGRNGLDDNDYVDVLRRREIREGKRKAQRLN